MFEGKSVFVQVGFVKVHPDAVMPQYMTSGSSGMDVFAVEDVLIIPGTTAKVRTGFKLVLPEGVEVQVRPRGGTSYKTKMRIANAPGTVDSDFRGEVIVLVDNIGTVNERIAKGERFAQIVLMRVPKMMMVPVSDDDFASFGTERSDGCLGSTGK